MHSPSATNPTGGAEARRVVTQPALHDDLMGRMMDPANMRRAWKRVKANKGAFLSGDKCGRQTRRNQRLSVQAVEVLQSSAS